VSVGAAYVPVLDDDERERLAEQVSTHAVSTRGRIDERRERRRRGKFNAGIVNKSADERLTLFTSEADVVKALELSSQVDPLSRRWRRRQVAVATAVTRTVFSARCVMVVHGRMPSAEQMTTCQTDRVYTVSGKK